MKILLSVKRALESAIEASNTMFSATVDAAQKAAPQLDAKLPLGERVKAVVDLYQPVYGSNHNVKAIFADSLMLLAEPTTPVSFEETTKGEDGKRVKQEVHTTAGDAVKLPKHKLREAAKQVRQDNGLGRAPQQRVPRTPEAAPKQAKLTDFAMADKFADLIADDEWLKDLAKAIVDSQATPATAVKQLEKLIGFIKAKR